VVWPPKRIVSFSTSPSQSLSVKSQQRVWDNSPKSAKYVYEILPFFGKISYTYFALETCTP
jgi:hypothetical protein